MVTFCGVRDFFIIILFFKFWPILSAYDTTEADLMGFFNHSVWADLIGPWHHRGGSWADVIGP